VSNSFDQPAAFVQRIAELTRKQVSEANEICRLADGRALERDYRPVLLDGTCVGHVWTYRDVSRRERDRAQLLRAAARMDNASNSDELTGLYNRRGFRTLGERMYAEARARHQHAVMVFADIDGLKEINAQAGHETGDAAIRATGEILRAVFASPDPIARLGADEFAILSIQNEPKSAAHVHARLQEAVDAWNLEGFRSFELSLSVGVAVSDTRSLDLGGLMAAADAALYARKLEQRSTRPPIVK
jgi:diguanylate cyclase (GGDEF)-like protein